VKNEFGIRNSEFGISIELTGDISGGQGRHSEFRNPNSEFAESPLYVRARLVAESKFGDSED
jgi:hypothetical protein